MAENLLRQRSIQIGDALKRCGASVTTAESCTGGWIAKAITDIAGSSAWFEQGFITYSNQAKQQMLGVHHETIRLYGAVSEAVVREMASGALKVAGADYAISVSGIAGPDGGSAEHPVGTVWFGFATRQGEMLARLEHFIGDREAIRRQAAEFALFTLWASFLKK